MHCRPIPILMLGACLVLAACGKAPPPPPPQPVLTSADNGGGAISTPAPEKKPLAEDVLEGTKWPPAELSSGTAHVSCSTDYLADGDGEPLSDLGYLGVLDALEPCRETGVVRLRYEGKIGSDFADLVERVTAMAERMEIDKRVLDIDSSGGMVEDGIRAGDVIADSGWTIWVREGDMCHSACVFVLAAGDNRLVSGPVGIHRIIRLQSTATTRAELDAELRGVHDNIKAYLSRNGVDVAVADMMMSVPSRALRLLTPEELRRFGISGRNPAQEDLERIQLARSCGIEFVHRKEAFVRAFEQRCAGEGEEVDAMAECGVALRGEFGFPDPDCPDQSPLSEYDALTAARTP